MQVAAKPPGLRVKGLSPKGGSLFLSDCSTK